MQRLEPDDKPKRVEFANTMLDRLGADPDFMSKIFFSDEAVFHVSVHDVIRLLIPSLYKNQSDSLMAADGDCHHLCKLMAPVRHRWSINDVIGGIRNTVMLSDCSPVRFEIRS
ncbi:hypothetical protein ANN_15780 [Periplaneta americana]|uniref:Uncharacterized protein n=1 Tax=Periplaneta americana TaxID=6978 RepID=A0ABQ8SIJ0_PERAM|nr:hypothetical protein ANN_15780 [Periplaneta americana]